MIHTGFNGRVQFDCTPPNLKTEVVREAMLLAMPEAGEWATGTNTGTLFLNLKNFLGQTRSIKLVSDESDETIDSLLQFWDFARQETDYRAIWNEFLMLEPEVNSQWALALNAIDDKRLAAPDLVQPDAPTDEALEAAGPDGKKKLRSGRPSSKTSTSASANS